jgi:hypothetical protein
MWHPAGFVFIVPVTNDSGNAQMHCGKDASNFYEEEEPPSAIRQRAEPRREPGGQV